MSYGPPAPSFQGPAHSLQQSLRRCHCSGAATPPVCPSEGPFEAGVSPPEAAHSIMSPMTGLRASCCLINPAPGTPCPTTWQLGQEASQVSVLERRGNDGCWVYQPAASGVLDALMWAHGGGHDAWDPWRGSQMVLGAPDLPLVRVFVGLQLFHPGQHLTVWRN